MKGTIAKCLEELVITKFGKHVWEKCLDDAGFKKPVLILPIADVDDAQVIKLVQAVCSNLNLTLPEAADAFGDYWVNVYSQKVYHQFYERNATAKDFLLDMNNVHVAMTQSIANARPPQFRYEWKDDKTLIIHYKSRRGLIDFAVGLARGVGKFYGQRLKVTKLGPDQFQVEFP